MPSKLSFQASTDSFDAPTLVVIGKTKRLFADDVRQALPAPINALWERMLEAAQPGDHGAVERSWCDDHKTDRVIMCVVPELHSRHNSPARPDSIYEMLVKVLPKGDDVDILLALDQAEHAMSCAIAVARAFPLYQAKSGEQDDDRSVRVALLSASGDVEGLEAVTEGAASTRMAARLVDTPASELNTSAFVEEARRVAAETGAKIEVISGESLRDRGFGGLWGVGKAATHPPALVVLSHEPDNADRTLCWVGKGIVYDTGGLSIKGKNNMPGMKADMAGAAAVLGAFRAAVRTRAKDRIHAILCLAENSVGPEATRPDDILHLYSGKSVEVNNTDAEGRLVLGDGVAYAAKHLEPDIILDMATLTGAQLVATGKKHAAVICNDDELEAAAIRAGKRSGDLVHPLPYCPEFFRKEFKSEVADLKNSVKDRANAQCSCAAQFVAEHLSSYVGPWLHVDMAGAAGINARASGYGVALLLDLFISGD